MRISGRINIINTASGDKIEVQDNNGNVIVIIDDIDQITLVNNPPTAAATDFILLRDQSSGVIRRLGIGTGLSVSGGNLISTGGGGSGSPGGSNTQVQYNNNGAFGGAANVTIQSNDLAVAVNSSPSSPSSNNLKYIARSVNNKVLPAFVDPYGLIKLLQTSVAFGRVGFVLFAGNSTTVSNVGLVSPTATGTATAANVATTNVLTAHRRLDYLVTTASTTAVAGFRQNNTQLYLGSNTVAFGGFTMVLRWGPATGQAANSTRRFFAGITSNTSAPTDVDPTSGTTWANMIAVVADAADTNLHIAHRSGTGSVTKIDTGMTKSYNDNTELFELLIHSDPSNSSPQVFVLLRRLSDGQTFSTTITTNLPAANTLLTYQVWSSVGGTNAVIGVTAALVYVENNLALGI